MTSLRAAFRFTLPLLALLSLLTPAHAAEDHDRWYVVLINGQRAGWSHDYRLTDADRITTTNTMSMVISRGREQLSFSIETEFVETTRGEPISARASRAIGSEPILTEMIFTADQVEVTTAQGDRRTTRTQPAPPRDAWLTPAAAAEFVKARLQAGATSINYSIIDPSSGLTLVTTTMTDFRKGPAVLLDRTLDATRCLITTSAAPGLETTAWLDDAGVTLRSQVPFGGLELTLVLADQATAMLRGEAPELMVETLIRPSRPIHDPRRTRDASYILSIEGQARLPEIPVTSVQSVEPLNDGRIRVRVNMNTPASATDEDTAPFLASSAMLDTDDPELIALAQRALGPRQRTPDAAAETLRRAVYRHIRDKTLGVGFATASETCRTRAGDCSEHAVLLAALLRIQGIPSRVVSGLVYADAFLGRESVFGFHMWTQALLDVAGVPTWVDLDATLNPSTPFDATHIALVVSPLSDDAGSSDMTAIATLLGTLRVQVEHTRP